MLFACDPPEHILCHSTVVTVDGWVCPQCGRPTPASLKAQVWLSRQLIAECLVELDAEDDLSDPARNKLCGPVEFGYGFTYG